MSVALAYGEFCEKMGAIKIEEHIFHHAKRATIDWFASTIPGGLETPARLTFQALKKEIEMVLQPFYLLARKLLRGMRL